MAETNRDLDETNPAVMAECIAAQMVGNLLINVRLERSLGYATAGLKTSRPGEQNSMACCLFFPRVRKTFTDVCVRVGGVFFF
jgi:hypothetical protein